MVSATSLCIFQLPAINGVASVRPSVLQGDNRRQRRRQSEIGARRRRRWTRDRCESATPARWMAITDSPPPTTVKAEDVGHGSSPPPECPRRRRRPRRRPWGRSRKTVFARARMAAAYRSRLSGPEIDDHQVGRHRIGGHHLDHRSASMAIGDHNVGRAVPRSTPRSSARRSTSRAVSSISRFDQRPADLEALSQQEGVGHAAADQQGWRRARAGPPEARSWSTPWRRPPPPRRAVRGPPPSG